MKTKFFTPKSLLAALLLSSASMFGQGTIETSLNNTVTNGGNGVTANPIITILDADVTNAPTLNGFTPYSPQLTLSVYFRNQQFTNLNYGSVEGTAAGSTNSQLLYSTKQNTGLVFGAGPTTSITYNNQNAIDNNYQGAFPVPRFTTLGAYNGGGGPKNNMFTSSPNGTPGMGIDIENGDANGAVELFTTAQALYGSANAVGSRVYFGDVVFEFNKPVKNPVLHIAGLGGSYRFLTPAGYTAAGNTTTNYNFYTNIFFSTELEMVNTGLSQTLLSGNGIMTLSGTNNTKILNNITTNPNGGSFNVATDVPNDYGAATGSIRVNGTVQKVIYRVYLRSGTSSPAAFPWSCAKSDIYVSNHSPFTGDQWYVAATLDRPNQQVSGKVFYDVDGISGNIQDASGVENVGTDGSRNGETITSTSAGLFFANLLDASGLVVATTPIGRDGTYLFDNVAVTGSGTTYSVSLSATPGNIGDNTPTTPYPFQWTNTGQQIGLIPGTDGSNDGKSSTFVLTPNGIQTQVNFGIINLAALPVSLLGFNGTLNGTTAKLNWLVTNEISFANYILERSFTGANFTAITSVLPRGNANGQEAYSYNDNVANLKGKIYYRLKMVDKDGTFKYSNIVIVKIGGIKIAAVYPNPFVESVKVELESDVKEIAQVRIIALNGKVAIQSMEPIQVGGNQFTLNGLSRLASGIYTIEVKTTTGTLVQQLNKN